MCVCVRVCVHVCVGVCCSIFMTKGEREGEGSGKGEVTITHPFVLKKRLLHKTVSGRPQESSGRRRGTALITKERNKLTFCLNTRARVHWRMPSPFHQNQGLPSRITMGEGEPCIIEVVLH